MSNKIQFNHTQKRKKELNMFYEKMYLDWLNNYLTVDKFAEHNQMSKIKANEIINKGRIINHNR